MTSADEARFQFSDQPVETGFGDARVVRVPAGILRKRELLTVIARGLNFPKYFGWNWDAFEECLCDLSWIAPPRRIVLLHDGLPFQPDWENRSIYLSILKAAIGGSEADPPHELIVVFPEHCRAEVERGC
jgi:Barstar (barnase inhibitor)